MCILFCFQNDIAQAVANLIWQCSQRTASPNPNSKIIKNLCSYVCADSDETPHITNPLRFAGLIFF